MKKRNLVLFGSAAMLSLALAGSLGTFAVASAEEINQSSDPKTGTTPVTYTKQDSWSVTIPESITIGGEGGTVEASGVVIEDGKALKVTVSSTNNWYVKTEGKTGFKYKLKAGGTEITSESNTVLTVDAGTPTESVELTAEINDSTAENKSTGGNAYTDTLTFSVAVANAD